MSDIQGKGYGSAHDWQNMGTYARATHYICRKCGAEFLHHYSRIPEIFKAIHFEGVPEQCVSPSETDAGRAKP
jgi:hypothetical protein